MVERYHTLVGHRADHGHTNTGIYYRRRRARRYAFTLATLLTLGSAGWADAFSNHPLAKTNYTHTPLTPVLGCADLLASSYFRYTIIANEKVSIVGIESHSDNAKQTMSMIINMEVTSSELLTRVIDKIRQLDDVIDVKRL